MAVLAGILVGVFLMAFFQQRAAPAWLPSGLQWAWNYALALKTLTWDERELSAAIEAFTQIPILTVSGATGAYLLRCSFCWQKTGAMRSFLKQMLTTPPRKSSSAKFMSEENLPVRRIDFD